MRYIKITTVVAIAAILAAGAAVAARQGDVLTEGRLIAGTQGRVVSDPNENRWIFVPESDADEDGSAPLASGGVEMLPCSVLEQMIQLAEEHGELSVRLWAMVTTYHGKNYLYSLYFLPMRPAVQEPPEPVEAEPDEAADPQDRESVLPTEILQMMQRNRAPDLRRLDELVVVSTDRNLIHRTGIIKQQDDVFVFTPDGFGHNVDQRRYHLLPCRTLETMQYQMQRPVRRQQRYVVSGVITEFDGQTYFLPRRAVRSFSHGNFTP